MITKICKTLTIPLAAGCLFATSTAAVAPLSSATYNTSVAGTVTTPVSFTSITVGGQTYSNFTYGTAIRVGNPERYYTVGDDPGTPETAVSNSNLTDGVLNIPQDLSINFGRAITAEDLVFVTELVTGGSGETLAMGLIDSGNTIISGTAVNFGNVGAGAGDLFSMEVERSDGGTLSATVRGSGVFLSDFGDPGSNVPHGIYFSNSSANVLDPSVIGLAVIPEPSTLVLMLGSLSLLFFFKKRGGV